METKSDLRPGTRCNYMGIWKNTVKESVLGNMKIGQIKQSHIRAFYADLTKQGLSANTIKLCHSLIFPALEMAMDSDIIRKNPAKDCKKGISGTKKEKAAMCIKEQEAAQAKRRS